MTSPRHHSIGISTDPHPVRPGTSAALTARTIDATVHPPIVRAQEAVAAFIPRVEAPIKAVGSPILVGMFGATLVLLLVAHRARFRPGGLVFSAMLIMLLTSFHPLTKPLTGNEPTTIEDAAPLEQQEPEMTTSDEDHSDMAMPQVDGMDDETAGHAPPAFEIPPELLRRVMPPEEMIRLDREMMRHDRERLRASLEELAVQLRKEARRNARHYYHNW